MRPLRVHELSEDDCLKYFSALKLSIEMILKQKVQKKNFGEETLKEEQGGFTLPKKVTREERLYSLFYFFSSIFLFSF